MADDLQPVKAALAALLDGVTRLAAEPLPLDVAGGRVLADSVTARLDVPPFDNSAMDGYALNSRDAGQWLPISQRITAGQPAKPLAPGSCARIFTGGEIPPGADCVVMQERVERDDELALFPAGIPAGDNLRRRGRDVSAGAVLLEAGQTLNAAALGHLAGQGITEVSVTRRPRVALLSTGDEVIDPGQPLAPGQIYNSNRPMLRQLIEQFGAEVVLVSRVADDLETTRRCLADAAAQADMVVSTGGVSVGEEDHVKTALTELGELDLWRLAIRPGKPLAIGRLPRPDGSSARFVGLPGNPVSGFVGAWLFLRPLVGALLGCPALAELPQLRAYADFATRTQARQHYMRVALTFTTKGITARAFRDQNSGVLSSCIQADALAVIPPHSEVRQGDEIDCLWLV
ncbi:molybdopterin molybdotransferase [Franzmannia pantelleriensis]|uniref:Molybdopterin molybdenumtransferase n=1 Tax=Franzmannia pantelleriensis TaxID=48727 RepID=A0A1G9EWN3_9GAMM|nr:gephyrin-like molybdotransferase Glp [Halomonas pantelleriensis]SDK80415.1 molybdopterin molybdotransferase [Halomonas pantelleriensis]